MFKWLDQHPLIGFLLGVLILVLVVVWPDLKAKTAKVFPVDPTTPERLDALEKGLADALSLGYGVDERIGEHRAWVSELERRIQALEKRS